MMKFRFLLSIVLCCFLFGCSEDWVLGSDYYAYPSYRVIDEGYPYGSIIYKSPNHNIVRNVIIYANVIKYKRDNYFICIKQIPDYEITKKELEDGVESWNNFYMKCKRDSIIRIMNMPFNLEIVNQIVNEGKVHIFADSILSANTRLRKSFLNRINYWIINKPNDSLIGPLTKVEFETTHKELKIPGNLKLD